MDRASAGGAIGGAVKTGKCVVPENPTDANRPSVAKLLGLGVPPQALTDVASKPAFPMHLVRSIWQTACWGLTNMVQRLMRQWVC